MLITDFLLDALRDGLPLASSVGGSLVGLRRAQRKGGSELRAALVWGFGGYAAGWAVSRIVLRVLEGPQQVLPVTTVQSLDVMPAPQVPAAPPASPPVPSGAPVTSLATAKAAKAAKASQTAPSASAAAKAVAKESLKGYEQAEVPDGPPDSAAVRGNLSPGSFGSDPFGKG